MDIQIDHSALKRAVDFVGRLVPRRSPKPVLENILVRTDPDGRRVRFFATDLECEAATDALVLSCDQPGRCLLPYKRITQILGTVDGTLRITADGDALEIGTGWLGTSGSFTLALQSPDDYPTTGLGLEDEPGYWECEGAALAAALNATVVAADPDSVRYALGGVRFEKGDHGGLDLVGTDGRRLHWARLGPDVCAAVRTPYGPSSTSGGVLPVKACHRVIELAKDAGKDRVRITLGPNRITVISEGSSVASRACEGRFPRWQDILPTEAGSVITFATGSDLTRVLQQAAITTSEESRSVIVEFDAAGLTAGSRAADVGRSRVDGTHGGLEGEPVYFACDPKYVTTALQAIPASDDPPPVRVRVIDHKSPVVFEAGTVTCVVMPLMFAGEVELRRITYGPEPATATA